MLDSHSCQIDVCYPFEIKSLLWKAIGSGSGLSVRICGLDEPQNLKNSYELQVVKILKL